jgi:hypothetical protein
VTSKITVNTGIEEITFGSGGGFTGAIKSFKLNTSGKLFENDTVIIKVSSKKTIELFNKAELLKDFEFNRPDNLYRFIEIKTKEKTNRIVWAFGSMEIDKKALELYDSLISNTK